MQKLNLFMSAYNSPTSNDSDYTSSTAPRDNVEKVRKKKHRPESLSVPRFGLHVAQGLINSDPFND